MMKKVDIGNYSVEELEDLLKSKPDYVVGIRIMALIMLVRGMSSRELEKFYHKSHSRFCVWAKNFKEKGVEGLKNEARSGRKPKLSKEQLEELNEIILNHNPDEYGYNSGVWTGMMLIDLINKKFNIAYKKPSIYKILQDKLGLTYQKGRGYYPDANKEIREEFKKELKKN
jgi:transposase